MDNTPLTVILFTSILISVLCGFKIGQFYERGDAIEHGMAHIEYASDGHQVFVWGRDPK